MIKISFLIAGFKGLNFFEKIHKECKVAYVSSYAPLGTLDDSFRQIRSLCRRRKYRFISPSKVDENILGGAQLVFIAGWQYFLNIAGGRCVVMHDSLLPKLRGFSPTVTALIAGEKKIGVTAFRPDNVIDHGPIYEQISINVKYPVKIKDAYLKVSDCYAVAARNIIERFRRGKLVSCVQDESRATYSLWRDEQDYFIDWNQDAARIKRFVDATGWPYRGAKTIYQSKVIIIDDVDIIPELKIQNRIAGKIWSLNKGFPEVVCGKGMVRIVSARSNDDQKINFIKLRERLISGP